MSRIKAAYLFLIGLFLFQSLNAQDKMLLSRHYKKTDTIKIDTAFKATMKIQLTGFEIEIDAGDYFETCKEQLETEGVNFGTKEDSLKFTESQKILKNQVDKLESFWKLHGQVKMEAVPEIADVYYYPDFRDFLSRDLSSGIARIYDSKTGSLLKKIVRKRFRLKRKGCDEFYTLDGRKIFTNKTPNHRQF